MGYKHLEACIGSGNPTEPGPNPTRGLGSDWKVIFIKTSVGFGPADGFNFRVGFGWFYDKRIYEFIIYM